MIWILILTCSCRRKAIWDKKNALCTLYFLFGGLFPFLLKFSLIKLLLLRKCFSSPFFFLVFSFFVSFRLKIQEFHEDWPHSLRNSGRISSYPSSVHYIILISFVSVQGLPSGSFIFGDYTHLWQRAPHDGTLLVSVWNLLKRERGKRSNWR